MTCHRDEGEGAGRDVSGSLVCLAMLASQRLWTLVSFYACVPAGQSTISLFL